MQTKKYTLCVAYSEEMLLNLIDQMIYNIHQSNNATDEYCVTVTVQKYED